MLLLRAIFFFTLSFITRGKSAAQHNCDFKLDTLKILRNTSLNKMLTEFKNDAFEITNNSKDIPPFIKEQLDCWTNGFSIANPGQPYQSTDFVFKKLPYRKLVFLAKSDRMLVMTYLKGGIGTSRHVLFIQYEKNKITDFWSGNCVSGMDTKAGIIKNINNINKKGKLNNNSVYL